MKPRVQPDPGRTETDRAEVCRLLAGARGGRGPWWPIAVANLERLAVAEVPDVAEARRWFRYGHHVVDDQASAAAGERRP